MSVNGPRKAGAQVNYIYDTKAAASRPRRFKALASDESTQYNDGPVGDPRIVIDQVETDEIVRQKELLKNARKGRGGSKAKKQVGKFVSSTVAATTTQNDEDDEVRTVEAPTKEHLLSVDSVKSHAELYAVIGGGVSMASAQH